MCLRLLNASSSLDLPMSLTAWERGVLKGFSYAHTAVNTSSQYSHVNNFQMLFVCILQLKICTLILSEAHAHTHTHTDSECVTVGQGELRNAVLLRGGLNTTQQVTALTHRHSAVHKEAFPPAHIELQSPLMSHFVHICVNVLKNMNRLQKRNTEREKKSFISTLD